MSKLVNKNIDLFKAKRDEKFLTAVGILEKLLKRFPESNGDKHYVTMFQYIERLVYTLNDAEYYAKLSINRRCSNISEQINVGEQAYTDLIETIFKHSQSIKRMYEHEMKLQKLVEQNNIKEKNVCDYVDKNKKSEHELIYKNLKNMKDRIDNYNIYICELPLCKEE